MAALVREEEKGSSGEWEDRKRRRNAYIIHENALGGLNYYSEDVDQKLGVMGCRGRRAALTERTEAGSILEVQKLFHTPLQTQTECRV